MEIIDIDPNANPWAVVEYTSWKPPLVEAVPSSWLYEGKVVTDASGGKIFQAKSYWPAQSSQVEPFLRTMRCPGGRFNIVSSDLWEKDHDVIVMDLCDTYDKAKRHRAKAVFTDNLDTTDMEEQGKGRRHRKRTHHFGSSDEGSAPPLKALKIQTGKSAPKKKQLKQRVPRKAVNQISDSDESDSGQQPPELKGSKGDKGKSGCPAKKSTDQDVNSPHVSEAPSSNKDKQRLLLDREKAKRAKQLSAQSRQQSAEDSTDKVNPMRPTNVNDSQPGAAVHEDCLEGTATPTLPNTMKLSQLAKENAKRAQILAKCSQNTVLDQCSNDHGSQSSQNVHKSPLGVTGVLTSSSTPDGAHGVPEKSKHIFETSGSQMSKSPIMPASKEQLLGDGSNVRSTRSPSPIHLNNSVHLEGGLDDYFDEINNDSNAEFYTRDNNLDNSLGRDLNRSPSHQRSCSRVSTHSNSNHLSDGNSSERVNSEVIKSSSSSLIARLRQRAHEHHEKNHAYKSARRILTSPAKPSQNLTVTSSAGIKSSKSITSPQPAVTLSSLSKELQTLKHTVAKSHVLLEKIWSVVAPPMERASTKNFPKLGINKLEKMDKWHQFLEDEVNFFSAVNYLVTQAVGTDLRATVYNMLKTIMKNIVACQYNMDGKKRKDTEAKLPFKDTLTFKVIKVAVKKWVNETNKGQKKPVLAYNANTVKDDCGRWLKDAPKRFMNEVQDMADVENSDEEEVDEVRNVSEASSD